jgi:asparagine synthase (glutamine-hydrolysing)
MIAPTGRDPGRAAKIAAALSYVADETASFEHGALAAAWSPPDAAARERNVTAVLSGRLHTADRLASTLGLEPDAGEARLAAAAFRTWGLEALERLRGVYTLLLVEDEPERVVLAVDALGAGGLFWKDVGGELAFASEVTHLLRILPRRPAPDRLALAAWDRPRHGRPRHDALRGRPAARRGARDRLDARRPADRGLLGAAADTNRRSRPG